MIFIFEVIIYKKLKKKKKMSSEEGSESLSNKNSENNELKFKMMKVINVKFQKIIQKKKMNV